MAVWDTRAEIITLSTGRTINACGGDDFIGIHAKDDKLSFGYDMQFWPETLAHPWDDSEPNPLTKAERRELADLAIALWNAWAER